MASVLAMAGQLWSCRLRLNEAAVYASGRLFLQILSCLMKSTSSHSARFHFGTIEHGARGPILRDDDGLRWRLGFIDESAAEGLDGRVRVRGRIVDIDWIEVEFVEVQGAV